jgi:hypothetical protein
MPVKPAPVTRAPPAPVLVMAELRSRWNRNSATAQSNSRMIA